ncbi:bifunctional metallophosphatase/5'-nucleotidase [Staphylococcus aureus]|nr:5'-nucleotidase C-terminal domain-containing protein [Staphylococcus aureus]
MKKIYKSLTVSAIVATVSLSALPQSLAITHESQPTKQQQTVLFDRSHGQTAGAADWVSDGAFSDYADSIQKQGYDVKAIDGHSNITEASLKSSKIFVIPEANIPFKESEQAAIVNYVKQGGNVVFISDHYNADRNLNRIDSSEAMNGYRRGAYEDMSKGMNAEEKSSTAMQGVKSSDWLSTNFGVRFRYNALGDLNTSNIVSSKESFGITEGVKSVSMHAGSTLAITNPEKAKGIVYTPEQLPAKSKWSHAVDQGIYNGGGKAEGPYVAISKVGKGKAAFIGDSSLVEDSSPKYVREDNGEKKKTYDGFKEQDNGKLLNNITAWMSKDNDGKSLKASGLTLDTKTKLLDFERPERSTEPEKEPWSQPPSGYKWYDPKKFKAGSYGSEKGAYPQPTTPDDHTPPNQTEKVSFDIPQNVSVNEPFEVTIHLKEFEANQTLQQHLPEMKRHADIIVVCYHGGFEKDLESGTPTEVLTGENEGYAMLEAFSKDIDIFITGHQHRQIAERFKDTAVIQPGTRGTTVGKVVLSTDEYENVSVESCELLPVIDDPTFTIDEDDQHIRKQLEDWLDYEITTLPYDMTINHAFEARVAPHPFTNFMNYALLEKSGADVACTALFDSASGFKQVVTMRDVINNYPFPNTFKVLAVSGAKLKEAIERSAEYFDVKNDEVSVSADFLEPKPQHFNYDIYGGVSYTIHVGRPKGQRVSNMMIQGHAVDLKQTYTICVNNYRAVGGGQYDMYIDAPVVKDIQVEGAQLLIDFLSNNNLMRIPQVVDFKVEK